MRTRFEGRSEAELEEMLAELNEFRERVLENAGLQSGDIVADVGAGTGLLTLGALRRVGSDGDVIALDISVDALEELRRMCTAPNVAYLIGSADVLPLRDASVDAVLTRSVLIYVRNKVEAAREFFRVLRSGGRFSVFEPINSRNTQLSEVVAFETLQERVIQWERNTYGRRDDPMLDFDQADLEGAFREAGFGALHAQVEVTTSEVPPERTLNAVGAPGRRSLLETWRQDFSHEEVERLVAAVRAAGPIRREWPAVYLSGHKP